MYCIPEGVESISVRGRPALSYPSGGKVVIDDLMLSIWRMADGKEREDIIAAFGTPRQSVMSVQAALACLVKAGLLKHDEFTPQQESLPQMSQAFVSGVIVSYNSRQWLERCLRALFSQTYPSIEVIVVDNASADGSIEWLSSNYPHVRLIILEKTRSLASAINLGVQSARGDYFLLLNPDVELDRHAVAFLVDRAQRTPKMAAVAAKLKFLWASAFINGLGNLVGACSWGTDIGLGHLDLGQFDSWQEVPSVCFAAALISAQAWKEIGPLDEGFTMYYEDTEWSYRARLLGYSIGAAPQAVAYHAFSGGISVGEGDISPNKLRDVVFGRLRFITRILSPGRFIRFLMSYFLEDVFRCGLACLCGRWQVLKAYLSAWKCYIKSLRTLINERRWIQSRRQLSDKELFGLQRRAPVPLIWHGLPILTWDVVQYHYLPLLIAGGACLPDEFSFTQTEGAYRPHAWRHSLWGRVRSMIQVEGLSPPLHRLGRVLQWWYMNR